MSVANLAHCVALMAKSGGGKSTIVKRRFKAEKPTRLVIWSPDEDEDNYARTLGCKVVRDVQALGAEIIKAKFKVVFWPSMDTKKRAAEFTYFCRLVFAAKDLHCLVEELRYVTTPSYAPEAWAILSTRGRKKGIKLYGTSQRPAQIDKDFLGNCTEIYTGALKYEPDRRACAEAMQIDRNELAALQPLSFIHTSDHAQAERLTLKF
jgi:hypothetical protein